jgi:ketosteroid isomerase-like protein
MSQRSVETVRRVYDALAQRDGAALRELYDPEIEWDNSRGAYGQLAGVGVAHGLDELRASFREWYEAWEEIQFDCHELVDAGDQVISVVTTRGRGRVSGIEVQLTTAGVWTIRSGKVLHTVWFPTREEALEAVGLTK